MTSIRWLYESRCQSGIMQCATMAATRTHTGQYALSSFMLLPFFIKLQRDCVAPTLEHISTSFKRFIGY